METAALLAIINGAISAIEVLGPKIKELVAKGEITVDAQVELLKRIDGLRVKDYSGPEWKVS